MASALMLPASKAVTILGFLVSRCLASTAPHDVRITQYHEEWVA
jgi:hypothetical protein